MITTTFSNPVEVKKNLKVTQIFSEVKVYFSEGNVVFFRNSGFEFLQMLVVFR